MKKLLILLAIGAFFFGLTGFACACEGGDPNDLGDCDSFNVEVYPPDEGQVSFPAQVRFPMYVTNDIQGPVDSIVGMEIPLCFTSSNPGANAVIDPANNNTSVYPSPNLGSSIFRHLPGMDTLTAEYRNWMMDYAYRSVDWDCKVLDITYGYNFWFSVIAFGGDQRFSGGSRVLTATMTFTLDDTTTICVYGCFWPPGGWSDVVFTRSDAVSYRPQQNIPYCTGIGFSEHGDANGDSVINIADIIYMVNYLYRSGPPPVSFEAGDANCDDDHNIADIILLINYLYRGGTPPYC